MDVYIVVRQILVISTQYEFVAAYTDAVKAHAFADSLNGIDGIVYSVQCHQMRN